MNYKLLFIISLLLIVGCSKRVEQSELINKDGLMYLQDSDSPYSGEVFRDWFNDNKYLEGTYKDGKKDGLITRWNPRGVNKEYVRTYKDGQKNGLWTYYYDSGQKKITSTYEDGWENPSTIKCWDKDGNECECGVSGCKR